MMTTPPLVSVLLVLCSSSLRHATSIPTDPPRRRYQLTEEQPVRTFVADVKTDAQLVGDDLRFVVLTPDGELGRRLFNVEAGSGVLRTATVIDRDSICPGAVDCAVDVDIGVQPREHFRVLKLAVEIRDVNDHSPRFPSPSRELRVSESAAPGVLFHINPADDADGPDYGIVGYQLTSASRYVLQPLLPDRHSIPYSLRERSHNKTLLNKGTHLHNDDFLIRMLYKDSY